MEPMKTIDLRSDTVTRPTEAMRAAMMSAPVGDDVLGDDPTVVKLQEYVAALFEKEAALYVPSGTMANQICLHVHTRRGDELLCDRQCHVVNYEAGAPAVLSGILVNMIDTERGMVTAKMVRANYRMKTLHSPETRLVALENSHNHRGGTILPQEEILEVRKVCNELGLSLHLDGARLWNVHMATKIPLAELAQPFDSVSVCLSKGLGAPIGSVILGTTEFIGDCLRTRKIFGGGMRQVGIIAAAGIYAVKNNIDRLPEDHANARFVGENLNCMKSFEVDLSRVETNIILAETTGDLTAETVLGQMAGVGVLAIPFGPRVVRFVTHMDVSRADCEEALERIRGIFA